MTDNINPEAAVEQAFKREERFIVIKRKHLHPMTEASLRNEMRDLGISTVECVVVESDWPEYETVWRMIEERVSGRLRATEGDEPVADRLEAVAKALCKVAVENARAKFGNDEIASTYGWQDWLPDARAAIAAMPKSDWFAGEVDCDGNELTAVRSDTLQALYQRACEVTHHGPECRHDGRGDDHCTCDAVPFLRDLAALHSPLYAHPTPSGERAQIVTWLRNRANTDDIECGPGASEVASWLAWQIERGDHLSTPPAAASAKEREEFATKIAQAVMTWGAPHFKHLVSFNTLHEAILAVLDPQKGTGQ